MKKLLLFLFLTVFSLFGDDLTIKKLEFSGNDAFFTPVLKEAIGIGEESFYKFWVKSPEYTADDIESIKDEIIDFYHSKGFFNVSVNVIQSSQTATFKISENSRIKIKSVEINSPFYIKNLIALKAGDGFDADSFVKSKENIKKYLGENSMPKALFSSKAYIDIEKYEARLEFNITNTKKYKFGQIEISQMDDIEEKYIQNKLLFKTNEPYNSKKIDDSYKNLYANGVFESISIKPNIDSNETDSVPIDITLKKGKQRTFRAGVGYDTDEGPRVKAGWIHRNFFGNLKRFEAMSEASRIRQSIGAKIDIPSVFGLDFEDMGKYEKVKYDGYTERIISNAFKFRYPYKTTTHYLGLLTESGQIEADVQSDEIKSDNFFINAVTYEYEIDRRDSIIDAKNGFLIAWNVEFADNLLGSSINYLKTNLEAKKIISWSDGSALRDFLFAARGNIGTINNFRKDDIPVFKRYFAGGSNSNRGYGYRRLGEEDSHGNNVGGNSIIDYSFEARYKVSKSIWGVLFLDSTLLSKESLSFGGEYKPSVGGGFRYDTAVGPIRFDIGWPMREERKSAVIHVSFGQAF